MTKLAEIREAIDRLPIHERAQLRDWLVEEESPALLAAIDLGIQSIEKHGAKAYTREQLKAKVRSWATWS
jgi:hypothetical protein